MKRTKCWNMSIKSGFECQSRLVVKMVQWKRYRCSMSVWSLGWPLRWKCSKRCSLHGRHFIGSGLFPFPLWWPQFQNGPMVFKRSKLLWTMASAFRRFLPLWNPLWPQSHQKMTRNAKKMLDLNILSYDFVILGLTTLIFSSSVWWMFMRCLLHVDRLTKQAPQIPQEYGFSPVWVLICSWIWPLDLIFLGQYEHW